jgi:two-component system sensor histidine kinase HydH
MLINIIAAFVLIVAAVFFWRMSIKAEHLEIKLKEDGHLKVLGQMSAVLGHEIKNSVASVKGHAQLLAEKQSGVLKKEAEIIESEITYLDNLTGQILGFAKTGNLTYEKVYLDDLAASAVAISDCDPVNLKVDDENRFFYMDREKMLRVLVNLIINARQASGNMPVELSFDSGSGLKIEITDKGGGINPAFEDKIFDPFFTTKAKGTGLGLAFAKQVVESHGGTLTLNNSYGKGASFIIELPEKKGA